MSVLWIGRSDKKDEAGWHEYERLVGEAIEATKDRFPFERVVAGGGFQVPEIGGDYPYNRHVVLRFQSMEAALGFYNSPEYQRAAPIRRASSGPCELLLIEELPQHVGG